MGLTYLEAEELAIHLCGLDEDDPDLNIEDAVYEKYGIDFDAFEKMAGDLLPLCVVGKAALSGKMYKGFGADGYFIVKRELTAPDIPNPTKRKHKAPEGECEYCDEERSQGSDFHPPHDASPNCESGKRAHCSCDTCF